MTDRESCMEFRELAPELALGIADGEDRARGLDHLAGCAECRRHLEELSRTADEMLLLAPLREPPEGFESRVVSRIRPAPVDPPRWRRPLRILVPALTAAAATAFGMWLAYRGDHELASQYRGTLAEANGAYFAANDLKAPGGATVGEAFGYEGSPSWVLVVVNAPEAGLHPGPWRAEALTAGGRRLAIGPLAMHRGEGSLGRQIPIGLDGVSEVRVVGPGRGDVLEASFDH